MPSWGARCIVTLLLCTAIKTRCFIAVCRMNRCGSWRNVVSAFKLQAHSHEVQALGGTSCCCTWLLMTPRIWSNRVPTPGKILIAHGPRAAGHATCFCIHAQTNVSTQFVFACQTTCTCNNLKLEQEYVPFQHPAIVGMPLFKTLFCFLTNTM